MRRCGTAVYFRNVESVLESCVGDGHGDEKDVDDGAERAVVWASVEWDAVGGRGVGVWGGWGGGVDSEEGEGGEGEEEEGGVRLGAGR